MIYIVEILLFIVLIKTSYSDIKTKTVLSTDLIILFFLSLFFIFLKYNNPTNILEFAFVTLGCTVALELILTTLLQEVIYKNDPEYNDVVSIGEADYMLMFTVASLVANYKTLLLVIIVFSAITLIAAVIGSKKEISIGIFPYISLSLLFILFFEQLSKL